MTGKFGAVPLLDNSAIKVMESGSTAEKELTVGEGTVEKVYQNID